MFSPCRVADVAEWSALVIIFALAACLAVFLDAPVPLRSSVTLLFLVFIPGLAVVRFLRLTDPVLRLSLAVATSLALDVVVSIVMIYAGSWTPRTALVGIAAVAVIAAAAEAVAASSGRLASAAGGLSGRDKVPPRESLDWPLRMGLTDRAKVTQPRKKR
jgi:hypothetical protein